MLERSVLRNRGPALHRMALLAVCAQLSSMQVGVTTGAILRDVFENQIHVTCRTRHVNVAPAQWIRCLRVVVELRMLSDG